MGSVLISIPDITDADLVFSEAETRQILKFFWPEESASIGEIVITNDVRRLAQTALIAAIDGSYAMGFVEATFRAVARPGSDIKSFGRKLARRFAKHWWKHAKQHDLEDVKIYESVRRAVALQLKVRLHEIKNGIALRRTTPFYARATGTVLS